MKLPFSILPNCNTCGKSRGRDRDQRESFIKARQRRVPLTATSLRRVDSYKPTSGPNIHKHPLQKPGLCGCVCTDDRHIQKSSRQATGLFLHIPGYHWDKPSYLVLGRPYLTCSPVLIMTKNSPCKELFGLEGVPTYTHTIGTFSLSHPIPLAPR